MGRSVPRMGILGTFVCASYMRFGASGFICIDFQEPPGGGMAARAKKSPLTVFKNKLAVPSSG